MCLKWPSFVGIVVISLDAFLISFSVLRVPRKEIVIQCPTSHIVQVKRPGLAPFGIDQGNASSPLVNVALIHTQRRDFTDAQSCPIAQREDGSYPMGGVVLHQLVEHHALFLGEFGRSHGHHGWTLHQASGIATEIALIHCPPVSVTSPRWNGVPPGCMASQATKSRIVVRYVATVLGSRVARAARNSWSAAGSLLPEAIFLFLTLSQKDSPTRICG